jgi:hypothetical protein
MTDAKFDADWVDFILNHELEEPHTHTKFCGIECNLAPHPSGEARHANWTHRG